MDKFFEREHILSALTEPKWWWRYHCERPLLSDVSQRRSFTEDVLYDALYGKLSLTGLAALFLSHPVVWRLSAIRQLGLTYYKWPSATHTRLAHSLDVAQMAYTIMKKLNATDSVAQEAAAVLGLIHDLGQSAFSHAVDGYAGYFLHVYRSIAENLGEHDFKHPVRFSNEEGGGKLDDVVSVAFIHECKTLKELMSNYEYLKPEIVQYIFIKEWFKVKDMLKNDKLFVVAQLVFGHNKLWLDLDRLSYLVRDSYFIGYTNIQKMDQKLKDDLERLRELASALINGTNVSEANGSIVINNKNSSGIINNEIFRINYNEIYAVSNADDLANLAREVRKKLYKEVYEGPDRAITDGIVSYLFYRYLKTFDDLVNDRKNNPAQLDELKSALLGTLLMSDDVLIYNICRVLSLSNSEDVKQLCDIATRLREFLTLIDARKDYQQISNSSRYLILIRFDENLAQSLIDELHKGIKARNLNESQVISAMHTYFHNMASRLNAFVTELETKMVQGRSGQLAKCGAIFMPLHYVFKDLSSKTKHIMSSDNKNITFSDIEQIIKNYTNEKRVLVEVFLYCSSQLQNYPDVLEEYLGPLKKSIVGVIVDGMLPATSSV
jgi:HD superfamily phosphohydrolase